MGGRRWVDGCFIIEIHKLLDRGIPAWPRFLLLSPSSLLFSLVLPARFCTSLKGSESQRSTPLLSFAFYTSVSAEHLAFLEYFFHGYSLWTSVTCALQLRSVVAFAECVCP